MSHTDLIIDPDPHFIVDSQSRNITCASEKGLVIIQGDHNSERITFSMPRYIEGHDMMECKDHAQIHFINISNKDKIGGMYEADDLQVDPDDEYSVIFSWLISKTATTYVGTLNFMVRFACMEGSRIVYSWATNTYSGITVAESIDGASYTPDQYTDVLEQWYMELMSAGNMGVNIVASATDTALETIQGAEDASKDAIEVAKRTAVAEVETAQVLVDIHDELVDNIESKRTEVETLLDTVNDVNQTITDNISSVDEKLTELQNEGATQITAIQNKGKDEYDKIVKAANNAHEDLNGRYDDIVYELEEITEVKKNAIDNAGDTEIFEIEEVADAKKAEISDIQDAHHQSLVNVQISDIQLAYDHYDLGNSGASIYLKYVEPDGNSRTINITRVSDTLNTELTVALGSEIEFYMGNNSAPLSGPSIEVDRTRGIIVEGIARYEMNNNSEMLRMYLDDDTRHSISLHFVPVRPSYRGACELVLSFDTRG